MDKRGSNQGFATINLYGIEGKEILRSQIPKIPMLSTENMVSRMRGVKVSPSCFKASTLRNNGDRFRLSP